jgi:diguanylate cyclase (GGDEF)-like protein
MNMDPITALIVGGLLTLGLLIVGLILFSTRTSSSRQFEQTLVELQRRRDHQVRISQDQQASHKEIRSETQRLMTLFLIFPDLAKELSSTLTMKELEEGMVKTAQHLFDAQAVVFFGIEDNHLQLKEHRGLSQDQARRLQRISIGQGQIGWAAKKQIIMTAQDLQQESVLIRSQLQQQDPGMPTMDICAPLIHRGRLYGVLALAGAAQKKDIVKPLMMVVANFGVVAMENILLFAETQRQSDQDSLTHLYNNTYFYKYLDREIQKAARYKRPISIVIFDLDDFKRYNDRYGHLEGDQILRVVGELIKKDLRTVDIPCRYGGEEFAVILPETPAEQAVFVADRARQAVEAHRFSFATMTVSGGVATYPQDAATAATLLQAAEQALEQAKRSGRNRVVASSRSKKV